MARARRRVVAFSWWAGPAVVTGVLVALSTAWKASCSLPGTHLGLADITSRLCITDMGYLWTDRGLATHQFPYLNAVFTPPQGLTGAVEYPVLNGVLIWLVGLPARDDFEFILINALALGLCAMAVSILLRGLCGRRVWLWAAAPAIPLYVVYNWDAWTVLAATAAIVALAVGRSRGRFSARSLVIAGVLLGLGGAMKVYPLLILIPLICSVLWEGAQDGLTPRTRMIRSSLPVIAAAGVVGATNLPLMILNFSGWLTPIEFQSHRSLSADTMSIWFWVLRPFGHPDSERIQPAVSAATFAITFAAIAAVLVVCWRSAGRTGIYPLLPAALGVVAAYIVLGKVSSPQYILWLIPLLAVAGVGPRLAASLYAVDVVMFVAWFESFGQGPQHPDLARTLKVLVAICVFARAGITAAIAVSAIRSGTALPTWRSVPRIDRGRASTAGFAAPEPVRR